MNAETHSKPDPTGSPYAMSLFAGVTLALGAIKMFRFPTTTDEPSFINCFNFIGTFESEAMFWSALILSAALVWLSLRRRKTVVVFMEATMLWVVAYFALVGASAAPYAISVSGLLQSLIMLAVGALTGLIVVRWLILKEGRV